MQNIRWTEEEIKILKECYPISTSEEMQILLARFTKEQIRVQANKMKLKKNETLRKFIHAENGKRNIHSMYTDSAKKKKSVSIRNMIRMERLRIKYGLTQKTNRVFSAITKEESSTNARRKHRLKLRGYYLDSKNKKLYYCDNVTIRTERTERFYRNIGYMIINDPTVVKRNIGTDIKPYSTTI